jgi:molybdopterin-guanine dinucleotide biosynthesis protein A
MGRTKALMVMGDGRPMAAVVAETLAEVCREVVIVGPVEPDPALAAWRHLADNHPGLGPLAGFETLLASGLDTEYLICPCDMPLVTAEVLRMLTVATDEPAAALLVAGETDPRLLPLRLDASCLGTVERLLSSPRRAVRDLLASLELRVVETPAARARELVNVNTPADFDAISSPNWPGA